MKITLEQLKDANACGGGTDWFRDTFGEAYEIAEYTPVQQAGILMDPTGRQFFGWAVEAGLIPIWSMRKWNLYGADLNGADLNGADLRGAILYGAYLNGAYLNGANLRGAIGLEEQQ